MLNDLSVGVLRPAAVQPDEAYSVRSAVSSSEVAPECLTAVSCPSEGHGNLDDVCGPFSLILFVDVAIREGYDTNLFVQPYFLEQFRVKRSLQSRYLHALSFWISCSCGASAAGCAA